MSPTGKPTRVLLVDDEPTIISMVGDFLKAQGFEVTTAMDGEEAIQKAQAEAPDLVILDLLLPKLDGYSVCSVLKKDPRYQKIPVIIFTRKIDESEEELKLLCGADAYLRKPFKAQEMMAKIQALLSHSAPTTGDA